MILEKLIHFISYIKQDCLYNCNIFSNKYLEIYPNRVYNIKRKGGNHMEEKKECITLKTRLYQKYILEIESYLGISQYHQNLFYNSNEEDTFYNDMQRYIVYQDLLLLNDILDKNQMEHVFFAVYDDDDNNGEFESLKRKFYQQLKGKFPEFQKEQTFDMKIIKGPSIEELISKAYIGLGSASFIRVDEVRFFPSMFLLIRENDDILYKLRFLQKIQYPLDQKRVYRMLDGKFFMDVFGRSDLRINDAVYHFCVLSIDSRANLWKWITLTKEHEYIDQCYMDALSGNGFRR